MKTEYKELRKKLKNEFTKPARGEYGVPSSVGLWMKQCGIKPSSVKLNIICTIFGSVPYPHQEKDRKFIVEFLREKKYKEFKNAK